MNIDDVLRNCESELSSLSAHDKIDYNGLKEDTESAFRSLLSAMFPTHVNPARMTVRESLRYGAEKLSGVITRVVHDEVHAEKYVSTLLYKLPEIRRVLWTDITAAYEGDPAAKTPDEIVLAYPAFIAISAYRVAHELYAMNVPLIPRIITE